MIVGLLSAPAQAKDPSPKPEGDREKETTIFVPAAEMRLILGIDREGIFVPYGEYRRLYERAKEAYWKGSIPKWIPPEVEGPVIVQANYAGSIRGEVLQFEAIFDIVQNRDGPSILPFPLKGVGYQTATLNGVHVQIYQTDGEPRIILPEKGSHHLSVTFLVPIAFAEKKGVVSFFIPRAILGQMRITSDVFYDVTLKESFFASRRQLDDKVEIFGFIGDSETVSLEINNRRSFGQRKVKISSREQHRVFVGRDIVQREGEFTLTVQDGMAKGVKIEIGKNDQVYSLSGSGIAGWSRETQPHKDVLHVRFHVPISGQMRFSLKTYATIDPDNQSFHVTDTLIQDLFQRRGPLTVFCAKDTRITPGDVQFLKPLEPPSTEAKHFSQYALHGSYSLLNLPYRLTYTLREGLPRTRCHQENQVSLGRSGIQFRCENRLSGLVPGTTQFVFAFPDEYSVTDVAASVNGRNVKAIHHHETDKNQLSIEIMNPVGPEDEVSFVMESERFLDEDRLRRGSFTIAIPVVSYTATHQMAGSLTLSLEDVFLVEDMTMRGYTPSEVMMDDRPSGSQAGKTLAYRFRSLTPKGTLTLSYRKGKQRSRTVNYIAVDQDILNATAYVQYESCPGGQESFYFALPRWENGRINIVGPHIKEKKKIGIDRFMEAMKGVFLPDLTNHDIWNVVLQKEVSGTYLLSIDYQKKIRHDGSFFDVPLVLPVGVENDTGHIVVEASRDTEIRAEKAGLNEVETYELPTWPPYKPSNRIIESLRYFARPFTFRIAVLRRDELPVLATMVEKEAIQYTLGKDSDLFFAVDYAIRNTNLQFLEIRLPEHHILWGATLQGKGIKPRKGDGNGLLFQLPPGDDRINLHLVGYVPQEEWTIWKSFRFQSPGLTIPCMASQLRIFFPRDYVVLGAAGNFEVLPEGRDESPLVLAFLRRIFSGLYHKMERRAVFSPFERRKVKQMIGRAAPDREARLEKKGEGVPLPAPKVARNKGILSMDIRMPKEGKPLSASKLWGSSLLRVTFLSPGWKKGLAMCTALLCIALGFVLTGRGIMSPLGFLLTTLVLFTFLPLVILTPWTFAFNGAVLGSVLFTVMGGVQAIGEKRPGGKAGGGLMVFCLLLALLFFPFNSARAESRKAFPDIELYVPYGERIPFELPDSHEVFIPTEDYFRLRFLAEPPYRPERVFQSERDTTIAGLRAEGTIEDDTVRFTASLDVFVNHHRWALIELPFSRVFIEALKLDGKEIPARIRESMTQKARPAKAQEAIYEIPIFGAGHHTIDLVFRVDVQATRGKKTMAFGFPESLCTDFSLAIEEKDIRLEFEEPDRGYYLEHTPKGLIARASLSQKSFVKVSWFPKTFIKRTETPLVYADCHVDVLLDRDEVLLSQTTEIRVEKSSLPSMVFQIPSGLLITDVFSTEVRSWRVEEEKGQSHLEVVFKRDISETAHVLIKAWKKTTPGQRVSAVFLKPFDTERIRGDLNLYGVDDYRIVLENVKGLKISDVAEVDRRKFPGFELHRRYVFSGSGFEADILSLPRPVRVHAEVCGRYLFFEDLLTGEFDVHLEVKESHMTSARLRMPEGCRIRALHAEGISDYHVQDDRTLVLPFQYALRGKYRFQLLFEKELSGWDMPTIEGPELLDMEKIAGQCLVLFPRGFDIRETQTSDLWPIHVGSLPPQLRQVDEGRFGAAYAYRFEEKPFQAAYEASRKKPSIDVVKVYHARVEDNLVHLKVLSLFTIRSAPVHHFEILAPVELKDAIEIDGEGIQIIIKEVDGEDRVRLTVHTVAGIEDSYLMTLSVKGYIGKDRVFEMPRFSFPQATTRTEFVSVEKATVYQVETKPPQNFHEVNREMLPAFPAGVNPDNILWAYRVAGSGDWCYRLELKRLEREDLVTAMVSREDIKTLLIPQGVAIHEINFRVNNRVLQFLPLDFPAGAELWSLNVAGEPIRASIGDVSREKKTRRLLLPLIKSGTGDRSFEVKLIYETPVPKLGVWGKMNLIMVETGDIPVEKTTWTLLLPRTYGYPKFKSSMEEIDITVIEAEKTLDLAREYEYWTNLARTVTGGLRQRAVSNREAVMADYAKQQARVQQMQSDLEKRIEREAERGRQAMLHSAQSQNILVLDEARSIMESNRPVLSKIEVPEASKGTPAISGRKDIQGWQFKTRDFADQDKVERSIQSLFRSEDKRREVGKKQGIKGKQLVPRAAKEVVTEEDQFEPPPQAPAPLVPERPPVQQQAAPVKKSSLLRGLSSMEIVLPEQGVRHSFKKLGGNPTMTLTYRKKGVLSKLFSLLVLLAATAGTLKIRKWQLPVEKIPEFFKGKGLSGSYGRLMESRLVKVIPTLMMVVGVFLGLSWFIMGVGLNTTLILRYLSMKRYEKKEWVPPYTMGVFFKYLPSYMILASSFLLLITAFHPVFLVALAVSTILNGITIGAYAIVVLFTRRRVTPDG
jgi:hypothetical protein